MLMLTLQFSSTAGSSVLGCVPFQSDESRSQTETPEENILDRLQSAECVSETGLKHSSNRKFQQVCVCECV